MSEFNYSCNTCGLSFGSAQYQREHMHTDWHRYNLKRRVADLPPIPAEVFARKALEVQQRDAAPAPSRRQITKKELKRQEQEARRQQALEERLRGVHFADSDVVPTNELSGGRDFVSTSEQSATDTESESEGMDDVDRVLHAKLQTYTRIPPNVSFMDAHESPSTRENVEYLERKYGIVFPDEEHVSDWDGLIGYLNEKVALGNCCLSCGYMGRSLSACRSHMLAKQHIKIPFDTEEEQAELLPFYDFGEEDSDWEDVEADGDFDDDDADIVSVDTLDDGPFVSGYELVLNPRTGATAGHRSLNRYFRQRAMTPLEKPGQRAVRLLEYTSPGVTARAADRMIKQNWAEQSRATQRFNRGRKQQNYQKHFRDPLLQ